MVDEMYDRMGGDLKGMGHGAYSVKKLLDQEPKLKHGYFVVKHAKENDMVIVTADTGMARYCNNEEVRCILINKEKLLPIIKKELDVYGSSRQN